MAWCPATQTKPKARKEYDCDAYCNVAEGLQESDVTPEEWAEITAMKAKKGKILKGEKYIRISGKWDGDWMVFRASIDMDAICDKYDLYEEA